MRRGALTISIDLELAWGVWDILTPEDLRLAESAERPICAALLDLFDRYQVAATWAIVAAVLDHRSGQAQPGAPASWYAPDIVERIAKARAGHEIGSHGGRHIYFADVAEARARDDLAFAAEVHRANGLPFRSFVFPRNAVGHLGALAEAGLRTFRGPDVGWTGAARRAGRRIGQAVNLADKMLPVPPPAVTAIRTGRLVDIPGSMQMLGRNGPRRFLLPAVTRAKLRMGLARARRSGGTFHFWFHPSNFYYRRDEQLDTIAWFLAHAADEAARGHIEIRTMGAFADGFSSDHVADAQAAP
jgi:peptidoglycan/xylan/chitin deacetylase (PgdA/CDA1 family)